MNINETDVLDVLGSRFPQHVNLPVKEVKKITGSKKIEEEVEAENELSDDTTLQAVLSYRSSDGAIWDVVSVDSCGMPNVQREIEESAMDIFWMHGHFCSGTEEEAKGGIIAVDKTDQRTIYEFDDYTKEYAKLVLTEIYVELKNYKKPDKVVVRRNMPVYINNHLIKPLEFDRLGRKGWSVSDRFRAIKLAKKVGAREASRRTGIPPSTIYVWLRREKRR